MQKISFLKRLHKGRKAFFVSKTNQTEGNSWVANLFREKNEKQIPIEKMETDSTTDYTTLAKNLDNLTSINKETFVNHLKNIHQEIYQTIVESYENKSLKKLLSSVPSTFLCELAIENFVGSISNYNFFQF